MSTHVDHLTCRGLVDVLTDYLEGVVDPQLRADVERHIVFCRGCANYVEQMRGTIELLGAIAEDVPADEQSEELLGIFRNWRAERGAVIAYKFLREGGVGPFSRVRWPQPSADEPWVQATGPGVCEQRVHACRIDDLPEWLDAELWRVELAGDVAVECGKLVAARGRLLERVDAWGPETAAAFADECAERARVAAEYHPDAARHAAAARDDPATAPGHAAAAAFIAAHAAAVAAGDGATVADERAWQARRLAELLGLGA